MKTNCKRDYLKTTDEVHVAKVGANPAFVPLGKVYQDWPLGTSLYFVSLNWFYIAFFLVLLNWGVLANDLTLMFIPDDANSSFSIFFTAFLLLHAIVFLAHTYTYSSKHWVVKFSLVNYLIILLFFSFTTSTVSSIYIQTALLVLLSSFFFTVMACGGFISLSRFYSLNYLNNPHHDLTASNFFQVWLTYIELMLPEQDLKVKKGELSGVIITYYQYVFFFLVVYGILISYIRFLFLVFVFSSVQFGDGLDALFLLHFIGIVLICFDPQWRSNFNKVLGKDALHLLGYNTTEKVTLKVSEALYKVKGKLR